MLEGVALMRRSKRLGPNYTHGSVPLLRDPGRHKAAGARPRLNVGEMRPKRRRRRASVRADPASRRPPLHNVRNDLVAYVCQELLTYRWGEALNEVEGPTHQSHGLHLKKGSRYHLRN